MAKKRKNKRIEEAAMVHKRPSGSRCGIAGSGGSRPNRSDACLERGGSAIHRQLAVYGGIRPQSRCRSSRALTLVEREEISRGIAAKESIRSIAVRLGRSPIDGEPGGQPKRGL